MAKLDLTKYGITGATVIAHNPSYEKLFEEETKAGLEGYEKGQTLYGGLLMNIRMITTQCLRRFGVQ